MFRLLFILLVSLILLTAGCAYEYRQMTFRVVDAVSHEPIDRANLKSPRDWRFLGFPPEPVFVDGFTDRDGYLKANVPIQDSDLLVHAEGYKGLHLQHYLEKTPPTGFVLVEMESW